MNRWKQHLALLSTLLALFMLIIPIRALQASADELSLNLIRESGDAGAVGHIRISGEIVDDTAKNALLQTFSYQPGSDILQSGSRLLPPGKAAQVIERGNRSMSMYPVIGDYHYQFSAWHGGDQPQTWLAIMRYQAGGSGSQMAWVPADLSFADASFTGSTRYNPWYVLAGNGRQPLAQVQGQIYGIIPADEHCEGSSLLFRIDQWQNGADYQPDADLLNGRTSSITPLADLPLDQGTCLFGLFGHQDSLLLVSARQIAQQKADGQTQSAYRDLTVTQYRLDGSIARTLVLERTFNNLSNAYLCGDTLTLETSGSAWLLDLVTVGSELTYWGELPVRKADNSTRSGPYAAAVIGENAYLLNTVYYHPVEAEDGLTLRYADGTSFAAVPENLANARLVPRIDLNLAVYDQNASLIYQAEYDFGIQADYLAQLAAVKTGEMTESVRRYASLKIEEVAQR